MFQSESLQSNVVMRCNLVPKPSYTLGLGTLDQQMARKRFCFQHFGTADPTKLGFCVEKSAT